MKNSVMRNVDYNGLTCFALNHFSNIRRGRGEDISVVKSKPFSVRLLYSPRNCVLLIETKMIGRTPTREADRRTQIDSENDSKLSGIHKEKSTFS